MSNNIIIKMSDNAIKYVPFLTTSLKLLRSSFFEKTFQPNYAIDESSNFSVITKPTFIFKSTSSWNPGFPSSTSTIPWETSSDFDSRLTWESLHPKSSSCFHEKHHQPETKSPNSKSLSFQMENRNS